MRALAGDIVFLGKTLNSHSASLHPGVLMDTNKFNAGGNPAMDQHPIQGGVEILLVPSYATETRISCGLMGHLVCMQTLPSSLHFT